MKILLDTNIIIAREAHIVSDYSVSTLFNWLEKLKFTKMVHPNTKVELEKYEDERLKKSILIKLASYQELVVNNDFNDEFINVIKRYDREKDKTDNSMLHQVHIGRCDYLITEDRIIHKKALELGISNKVLNMNTFISICIAKNPNLVTYKFLPITIEKLGSLKLKDPFFDTLKESYKGFEKWVNENANDDVYITRANNDLVGLLALKIEDENEKYNDIIPQFEKMKRLKIRTLKVESTGFRLGERLIQVALMNAINNDVDEVYVTIFNGTNKLEALIDLFEKWGFRKHGNKISHGKSELVYVKDMRNYDSSKIPRENYPLLNPKNKFILPIFKEFHTNLFPESQLKNEKQTYSNTANRFAIQKVYVSGVSNISEVKPGDIVLIYRIGEESNKRYTSAITTITVVHEIKKIFNLDQYLKECENRTVFSKIELKKFFPRYNTIVKLLEIKPLNNKVILDILYNKGIVEEKSGPRPFHKLTDDQFSYIIRESKTKL